jgi:hypothetical protein
MALTRFGFIVTGNGYDPAEHRVTMSSPQITTIMVGVARPEQAVPVARAMVADGVQLIDRCRPRAVRAPRASSDGPRTAK